MSGTSSRGKQPAWKRQNRAWHAVTPPSGMTDMKLRVPSLSDLIANEAVPERLRAIALKSAAHPAGLRGVIADTLAAQNEAEAKPEGDPEKKTLEDALQNEDLKQAIEDVVEIQKRLIVGNVSVGGELLTDEDLDDPEFPSVDAEWLGGVMLRELDVDARGVRLGIEPLDRWARFRDFHECTPDCSACQALQDEFSSVDLGRV